MSLTSYRAAPPRVKRAVGSRQWAAGVDWVSTAYCPLPTALIDRDEVSLSVFCRPGDDLLSRVLRQSTIGAEAFDGRVRDGIGSYRLAESHQAGKKRIGIEAKWIFVGKIGIRQSAFGSRDLHPTADCLLPTAYFQLFEYENNQAERAISTGKLNALPRLHTRPINVVVFHGSSGRTRLEAGFPLRCLQRLSIPHIATLHCGWRHNRSTRDVFTPVLSY